VLGKQAQFSVSYCNKNERSRTREREREYGNLATLVVS